MNLDQYKIILGSASPRRKYLMESVGFNIEVRSPDIDEESVKMEKQRLLANRLAELKNDKIVSDGNTLDNFVVTADTIVLLGKDLIGKPRDLSEAKIMLRSLANHEHEVITGVCIRYNNTRKTFSDSTMVRFNELTDEELDFYLEHSEVLDKAGAYGIQDWIGFVGIRSTKGSFYNVMGLPVDLVYQKIIHWNT